MQLLSHSIKYFSEACNWFGYQIRTFKGLRVDNAYLAVCSALVSDTPHPSCL